MIVGIGFDMASTGRIGRALERFGGRFCSRVLSDGEIAGLPASGERRAEYVAARFAAKEAAVKALGTGFSGGIGPRDVEVMRPGTGKPELRLHGAAALRAAELGADACHVSLTHEHGMAGAVVVLECTGGLLENENERRGHVH